MVLIGFGYYCRTIMTQESENSGARSEGTKNVSFWIDEQIVEEFDKAIGAARASEAVGPNATRSDVLRKLMDDFIAEHGQGNPKPAAILAD